MKPIENILFDYRALRLLVGVIALTLPMIVSLLADGPSLGSISGSYYTDARDVFVGLLFVVGAFLWAYKGHTPLQDNLSTVAAIAAFGVALFPTACIVDPSSSIYFECASELSSKLHYGSAAVLFVILAIFCFVFFRIDTQNKTVKEQRRSKIYLYCGWSMVISMLTIIAAKIPSFAGVFSGFAVVYWAETAALSAFGIAWIVAGKYLSVFTDPEDKFTFSNNEKA